jgi:hypothetical protein
MTMERYVIIDAAGAVINATLWDGAADWTPGAGLSAIPSDEAQIGWTYDGETFSPPASAPEPEPAPPEPFRVTKASFGELFTDDEHAAMNLIRWQCSQMDAADRAVPGNPLVYAETLFIKFALPAEYIELDLPMVADGLGLLGMLGVFGDDAAVRIPQILAGEAPE